MQHLSERHLPAVSVGVTLAAVVASSLAGSLVAARVPDWVGHGVGHAVVAVPVAVLAVLAVTAWPPPKAVAPSALARRVLVAALLGVAAGQFLEVLGARVDEPGALALEGAAHTAGQVMTMLSMPALLAAGGLSAVAAGRAGTAPKWLLCAGFVVAVVAFIALFAGAPGA